MRVLVLQGGRGSERAVSLRSAAQVIENVRALGHTVALGDPADSDFNLEKLAAGCDIVLPMVHGVGGEDGVFQKQLEVMGKPFVGSGSIACALTFDKSAYRQFVMEQGVQMAPGRVVTRRSFEDAELRRAPYVLKPLTGGSSIDTLIVHDLADEPDTAYFDTLFVRHERMLLEQLISGQEITVGVLGHTALPVILIVPPESGEFDYENKYNGRSREVVNPVEISQQIQQQAQTLALQIHQITGCRHLSRTDMIVSPKGELYVLETNTLPGMTAESLFPKAATAAGFSMAALMECFLAMALEDLERGSQNASEK